MGEFIGVFLLACFTTFAMTIESMTTTTTDPSLRGTKQSSTGEFIGDFILDCFTTFAMTGAYMTTTLTDPATGACMTITLTDPSLRGTKQSSPGEFIGVFLLDCFTAFAMTGACMTTTITDSSLRGTKQSSPGEFIRVCFLACFGRSSLAMTKMGRGKRIVINRKVLK
jgi:hypothetical protein